MVIAYKTTTPPVGALLQASTAADVEALIDSVERPVWRKLGGDEGGNYAQVNSASSPADALIETGTNGFDALIEQEVQLAGRTDFDSPRQAIEALFDIPGGRLEFLTDPVRRRELAERISMVMRDGDDAETPTITVKDTGIGQHPEDFPRTLVSLNRENKRDKFYLFGAYGWGGSASLAFCKYKLFISRRDPRLLGGRPDQVGWTVVRFNDLESERTAKYGEYEYLCTPRLGMDGSPGVPLFDTSLLPAEYRNWSGTICTLIDYRIGRTIASAAAWLGSKSLRNICNALLFDTPFPFMVCDERERFRDKSPNARGVIVVGNAARLAELAKKKSKADAAAVPDELDDDAIDDEVENGEPDGKKEPREVGVVHDDLVRRQLASGGWVTVRYWVMRQSPKYKKDWQPTRSYVAPEQAITLVHGGQRHAMWGRDLFDGIGFTSLAKSIIAMVDADDLDWREKRQLFNTTRDQLKKTDMALELRALVIKALEEDDYLKGEEKKRRERALGHESKEQAEKIQKMLERAIAGYQAGKIDLFQAIWSSNEKLPLYEDQPLAEPDPPPPPPPPPPPLDYTGGPTFIRVLNAPVHIPADGRAIVRLQIDAPDDYFTRPGGGSFDALITKGAEFLHIDGYSSLRDGMMRCTIASQGATAGDRGRVIFTVIRGDDLPLVDDAELVVDPPKQRRVKPSTKQADGKVQGPPVKPCYKSMWDDIGEFDETVVARLVPEPGKPDLFTIYVNWDYGQLNDRMRRAKQFDEEFAENFKLKFVAAMGFLVWLQRPGGTVGTDAAQEELRRAAEVHIFANWPER